MGEGESVVITLTDIYREFILMRDAVQSFGIKIDNALDTSRDHEARLRVQENESKNWVTETQLRTELDKRSSNHATWINTALTAIAAIAAVVAVIH